MIDFILNKFNVINSLMGIRKVVYNQSIILKVVVFKKKTILPVTNISPKFINSKSYIFLRALFSTIVFSRANIQSFSYIII